jgi:Domain of unknown function (DUF4145)
MAFSWRCPFCSHDATIGEANHTEGTVKFNDDNKYGGQAVWVRTITCPNPACREYTLKVSVHDYGAPPGGGTFQMSKNAKHSWQLVPAAEMQVLPSYIPNPIVADYEEACLIRDLSPKSSATLARRCLQGMIRDFWGIQKGRLLDEIEAIEDKVDPLTWNAIDAVRNIGNIAAHMEKDINLVIDVDPSEAKVLIGLIETLIEDWYVNRFEREQRLSKVVSISEQKNAQKTRRTETQAAQD